MAVAKCRGLPAKKSWEGFNGDSCIKFARIRGLCKHHYRTVMLLVEKGVITKSEAEEQGIWDAPKSRETKLLFLPRRPR